MQTISVYLNKGTPALHAAFRSRIVSLNQKICTDPVIIRYQEIGLGRVERFVFSAWSNEDYTLETHDILRSFVAIIIAEWIVGAMEPLLIEHLLKRECAVRKLDNYDEIRSFLMPDQVEGQRAAIYKKVCDYLDQENSINLGGFVRFRLKDYVQALQSVAVMAIEEYVEEKQYKEFVQLLRHFISVQEAQCELVHVIRGEDQQFLLYDQEEKPIVLRQLEYMCQPDEPIIRDEDYLISALITLAPKRIVVHSMEEHQLLLQTLSSLYEDRIVHCLACTHCLHLTMTNPFIYNK
ncbi:MAG: sporulation protein YtxC [Clostridia bacterium]